jgi:hypothetical protein
VYGCADNSRGQDQWLTNDEDWKRNNCAGAAAK